VTAILLSLIEQQGKKMSQSTHALELNLIRSSERTPMFKVIYINDNKTTMEFVVDSLVEYFDYTADSAEQITVDIHQAGQATVAVLPYEIAEQKGIEVTLSARSLNYPLQIKLEPETVV
jgi:ATP-dependent Clp protease adaptor protein ClpS